MKRKLHDGPGDQLPSAVAQAQWPGESVGQPLASTCRRALQFASRYVEPPTAGRTRPHIGSSAGCPSSGGAQRRTKRPAQLSGNSKDNTGRTSDTGRPGKQTQCTITSIVWRQTKQTVHWLRVTPAHQFGAGAHTQRTQSPHNHNPAMLRHAAQLTPYVDQDRCAMAARHQQTVCGLTLRRHAATLTRSGPARRSRWDGYHSTGGHRCETHEQQCRYPQAGHLHTGRTRNQLGAKHWLLCFSADTAPSCSRLSSC
jgi:hypothetical protein